MAVSRALGRLLNVLELEEEQARLALESAAAELARLERARDAAIERERQGRRWVARSASTGEIADRAAGLEEQRIARRSAAILEARRMDAESIAEQRRNAFLRKRVERRQAATLIAESEARQALEHNRRAQQALDEGFLIRTQRKAAGAAASLTAPSAGRRGPGLALDSSQADAQYEAASEEN